MCMHLLIPSVDACRKVMSILGHHSKLQYTHCKHVSIATQTLLLIESGL